MTPRYAAYLAAVRPTSQLWRLVLGLVLIVGVYVLWMVILGGAMWLASGLDGLEAGLIAANDAADPWSLLFLLTTFLGGWFGVALALRLLHRRRLGSLFGRAPVVLRDFTLGVVLMVLIGGGLTLAALPVLPPLELATAPGVWAAFLPLALLGILIQTGAEEAVFRGYIQGQLAARFGWAPIWMGVPTVLFGLAHFAPESMGGNTWIIVASTGLFGLYASDLTARTGALGLAWGLHFANNVLAILVLSVTETLDGLALLRLSVGADGDPVLRPMLLGDMVLMTVVWLSCRLWLRRR